MAKSPSIPGNQIANLGDVVASPFLYSLREAMNARLRASAGGTHRMLAPTTGKANARFGSNEMASALQSFRQAYPAYASTWKLDELRATEYARLDRQGHVYLDYTG